MNKLEKPRRIIKGVKIYTCDGCGLGWEKEVSDSAAFSYTRCPNCHIMTIACGNKKHLPEISI